MLIVRKKKDILQFEVSFNKTSVNVEHVIDAMESQHNISFSYNDKEIPLNKTLTLPSNKLKISQSYISYMGPVVGSRVGPGGILIAVIPDRKP